MTALAVSSYTQAVRGNLTKEKEYDFSKGKRGKFFRPNVELNIPVYLQPQVAQAVREHARKRNTNLATLVNEWLREDFRSEKQRRKLKTRQRAARNSPTLRRST